METHATHKTETLRDVGRRLLIARRGARLYGVYADAVEMPDATDDWMQDTTRGDIHSDIHSETHNFDFPALSAAPAPLPGAPRAVRGVIVVRGRVYTLIDLAFLLDERRDDSDGASENASPARMFVMPLRGGEQLAIAVERIEAGG